MKPNIVLFNGPPYSGKDTVAKEILLKLRGNGKISKFAQPLKNAVRDLYLHGDQEKFNFYDSPGQKDLPREEFFGKSCRELQIAISETYFKPLHGHDVFGKFLAKSIKYDMFKKQITNFLISDSGFVPEAEVLIKEFGADNIYLICLHREGTNYQGDSRSYIDLSNQGVKTFGITNINGELRHTVHNVINIIQPLILRS